MTGGVLEVIEQPESSAWGLLLTLDGILALIILEGRGSTSAQHWHRTPRMRASLRHPPHGCRKPMHIRNRSIPHSCHRTAGGSDRGGGFPG